MSAALSNAIRQHARAALSDLAQPNIYLISSYDGQGRVKVTIRPPEGENAPVESNWMPLGQIGVGNGFGIAVGPQIGDQVMVVFEGGDINSGTVVARIHSTQAPSMPVPAGEIWMVHQSGSMLKFLNDGDVQVQSQRDILASAGRDVTVSAGRNASLTAAEEATVSAGTLLTLAAPTIALQGNLTSTGSGGAGGTANFSNMVVAYTGGSMTFNGRHIDDTHTHGGVQFGTSNTETPN